jgi:hypothetical protein
MSEIRKLASPGQEPVEDCLAEVVTTGYGSDIPVFADLKVHPNAHEIRPGLYQQLEISTKQFFIHSHVR